MKPATEDDVRFALGFALVLIGLSTEGVISGWFLVGSGITWIALALWWRG